MGFAVMGGRMTWLVLTLCRCNHPVFSTLCKGAGDSGRQLTGKGHKNRANFDGPAGSEGRIANGGAKGEHRSWGCGMEKEVGIIVSLARCTANRSSERRSCHTLVVVVVVVAAGSHPSVNHQPRCQRARSAESSYPADVFASSHSGGATEPDGSGC